MAPRAYWKGYLKLSLVSCPIALFPATSEREKISFHQLNKKTGNRIKYRKVDADTGDELDPQNIIKGYEVSKGDYLELAPEELEAVALDSTVQGFFFSSILAPPAHHSSKVSPQLLKYEFRCVAGQTRRGGFRQGRS